MTTPTKTVAALPLLRMPAPQRRLLPKADDPRNRVIPSDQMGRFGSDHTKALKSFKAYKRQHPKSKMQFQDWIKPHKKAAAQLQKALAKVGISSHIEGFFSVVIANSKGGEGSRGGKIIGHTKSGKPIYEDHKHPSHREFSEQEHSEAERLNSSIVYHASNTPSSIKQKRTEEHKGQIRQAQKSSNWHYGRSYEKRYGESHPHPKFKDFKR